VACLDRLAGESQQPGSRLLDGFAERKGSLYGRGR